MYGCSLCFLLLWIDQYFGKNARNVLQIVGYLHFFRCAGDIAHNMYLCSELVVIDGGSDDRIERIHVAGQL